MNEKIFLISLFGILIFASLVGKILRYYFKGSDNAVIKNLNSRINAWWIMVLILLIAFMVGRIGSLILFFIISFIALREFMALVSSRRSDYWALVMCFYFILPIQYFLIAINWYGMYSIFIPVYGFLILSILSTFGGDTKNFLTRSAQVQWSVMVTVYCLSHVPALLNLSIADDLNHNIWLIVFLITVVQFSDVMQYVWGKLLGKHKIAPDVSPSKTIEGFVGGILSATVLAGLLYPLTPFNFFQAMIIGFVICLMGFWGGLVMSAIKRDRGIKDWGSLIKGHGGMMDRVDSICFSAPVFFHIVRYFWT